LRVYRNIDPISPKIITKTIILENPAIPIIPRTERIHNKSKIEAIVWNGRGKTPIAQTTTRRIRISHKVTGWLLTVKRIAFGIEIAEIGPYPRSQRMIKITTIAITMIIKFRHLPV